MEFNIQTIIVLVIFVGLIVGSLIYAVMLRKRGKTSCGGDCNACMYKCDSSSASDRVKPNYVARYKEKMDILDEWKTTKKKENKKSI